ncbi:MAG: DUF3306 domain-containing protein [Pseudomonadota bacterium]
MSDFWARRKAAVAKEAEAEQAAAVALEEAKVEATLAERTDADILEEAKLPEPEALDSAEAVREFLASAVPQRLKTRALRQLWKLNPVLANLDGLIDYGEDFTDSATVVENLQTAYQVGKGMLAHIEAMAEKNAAENEDAAEEDDADDALHAEQPQTEAPDTEAVMLAEVAAPATEHDPEIDYDDAPRAPRRMQFRFEEAV